MHDIDDQVSFDYRPLQLKLPLQKNCFKCFDDLSRSTLIHCLSPDIISSAFVFYRPTLHRMQFDDGRYYMDSISKDSIGIVSDGNRYLGMSLVSDDSRYCLAISISFSAFLQGKAMPMSRNLASLVSDVSENHIMSVHAQHVSRDIGSIMSFK